MSAPDQHSGRDQLETLFGMLLRGHGSTGSGRSIEDRLEGDWAAAFGKLELVQHHVDPLTDDEDSAADLACTESVWNSCEQDNILSHCCSCCLLARAPCNLVSRLIVWFSP